MIKDIQQTIFGTPIWGAMLNEQKYQSRDYIDCLQKIRDTQISAKKSNFGGYQTHEDLHLVPVFRELIRSIEHLASLIISEYTDNKTLRLEIKEFWGNINTYRDYNAAHVHSGLLSGVFYLKTPQNCGRLIIKNPAVRSDGHIIRNKDYAINPEPLACIIFPSWLEHYVEPNMNDEERMSLSFNLDRK